MFIVGRMKHDGKLIMGTPPYIHPDRQAAVVEAERLASIDTNGESFPCLDSGT